MEVKIIKSKDGFAIGWTMEAVEEADVVTLNTVRNLQFFGFDDTAIKYNGRKNSTETSVGTLEWVQKMHSNDNS